MLVVNYNRVLMDESWDDPEDFRPERFLDNDGNIITPEKYFPFSIGMSLFPLYIYYYKTAIITNLTINIILNSILSVK